jgi:hypothetical protein
MLRRPDHRVQERDHRDDHKRRNDDRLDHRLVLALRDERPQPLVGPEQRQRREGHRHDPADRRRQQVPVAGVGTAQTVIY